MSMFNFKEMGEDVNTLTMSTIQTVVGDSKYAHSKVGEWTVAIGNKVTETLREMNPNFKYIVSTLVVQKLGAGLHLETLCSWDTKTDGSVTVCFDNDHLTCICTVLGLAI
jgi:dynein light chain Tctex-type 1